MLLTGGWAGGEAALWELRDEIKVRWHRCSRFAPIHLIPVGTICPLACTCALFITLQRTLTDCVLVVQSKDDDSSEASTGPATKLLDGKDVMYTGKVMIFCAAVSVLQFQCCILVRVVAMCNPCSSSLLGIFVGDPGTGTIL